MLRAAHVTDLSMYKHKEILFWTYVVVNIILFSLGNFILARNQLNRHPYKLYAFELLSIAAANFYEISDLNYLPFDMFFMKLSVALNSFNFDMFWKPEDKWKWASFDDA